MAEPPDRRGFRAVVHGRVQGVGFRYSAVREARSLGLSGTVANRFDGTVEVAAEGDARRLAVFVSWLHKGPPGSRVTSVDVQWLAWTGAYQDFDVDF
ncbi:MAG TPA: acylphosphatase [Spirochaetia bacterium]|nr:acylphosphatase [Spirochaetia bacterium]